METGREQLLMELAERATKALEKLAEDPAIEISGGPPVCPNCGKVNPTILMTDNGGTGPLGDFVLKAHCMHCNSNFFGMVTGWTMFNTAEELTEVMEGAGNGTNG